MRPSVGDVRRPDATESLISKPLGKECLAYCIVVGAADVLIAAIAAKQRVISILPIESR
jgi:hypothetical protein